MMFDEDMVNCQAKGCCNKVYRPTSEKNPVVLCIDCRERIGGIRR